MLFINFVHHARYIRNERDAICFVTVLCIPKLHAATGEFSRDYTPIFVYRYEGFTVDFVPLREGFYLRRLLGAYSK